MIDFKVMDLNDFYNLDEESKEKYIEYIIESTKKTKNQIIKKMANIVKRDVKHYQNDFYIHDVYLIKKHEGPFIWMTRPTGTDFIPLNYLKGPLVEWYDYVKTTNKNFYYYDGKRLKKVTLEEMEKIIDKYKKKLD